MMRLIIAACLLLALQGCTVIQSAQYAVARYCMLPEPARSANRDAVALAMAPNRISIHCAGGGQ
jgi:hypothetical protein